MTAVLPRPPAPSTPDPLCHHLVQLLDSALAEAAQLRAQLAAVVDAIVAEEMVKPTNYSIHPYTPAELAQIETLLRHRWATVAFNAVKDQS